MNILFDTNIISYLYDDNSPFNEAVSERFFNVSPNDRKFVSFVTLYELHYSIARSSSIRKQQAEQTLALVLENFEVIESSIEAGFIFGHLKNALYQNVIQSAKGIAKYDADIMIASSAISIGATLVSNDAVFENFNSLHPDFHLENWALPLD